MRIPWFGKKRTWELVKWEKWETVYYIEGIQTSRKEKFTRIWYVSNDGISKTRDVAGYHTDEEVRKLWPKP